MGKYSNEVKAKMSKFSRQFLNGAKIKVIWQSSRRLRNLFAFKDTLPMHLRSNILYKFTCSGCNSTYVGKTNRHYLVRTYEHLGVSLLTGNNYTYNPKNQNNTGILDHINQKLTCNGDLDSFQIIGGAKNDFYLCLKESLLISKLKPTINSKTSSIPLKLFA